MKPAVSSSLRTRLIFLIVLILTPIFVILCLDTHREFRYAETSVIRDTRRLSEFITGDIEQLFEGMRTLFTAVSRIYHAGPETANSQEMSILLAEIVAGNEFLTSLSVMDMQKDTLLGTGAEMLSGMVPSELCRQALQTGGLLVEWYRPAEEGPSSDGFLYLAHCANRTREHSGPLIIGTLDFGWLAKMLDEDRVTGRMALLPEGMELKLWTRGGTLLALYPESAKWAGRVLSDSPLHREILAKGSGTVEASGVDGISRIYSFGPVKGTDNLLFISVGITRRAALAEARESLVYNLTSLGFLIVALLVAAWIGTNRLIRNPVKSLLHAVKEVGSGRLDTRVHIEKGPREIIELADAVNHMAQELEAYDKERSRQQATLIEYEGQLRSMVMKASLAEEKERHRISIGLHDNIGQVLAACYMRVSRVLKRATEPANTKDLRQVSDLIGEAIQQTQSLTFDLSSPILHSLGLSKALERLCDDFRKEHRIVCTFTCTGSTELDDKELCILLFRTAQELLFNVGKHAQASSVQVWLHVQPKRVRLVIQDDGSGFDVRHAGSRCSRSGGFGLFSVRERVTAVNGKLRIQSTPGEGTRIAVVIPVKSASPILAGDKQGKT